jgi:hypothetical protein
MLKNKATYQTQLILNATSFTIMLIASAKDVPAGKQICLTHVAYTITAQPILALQWLEQCGYINILIIYLLTTYKLLHVYI